MKTQKDEKPPYHEVQKFLNSGLFYYSFDYPLTHSLQRQHVLETDLESKVNPKSLLLPGIWLAPVVSPCLFFSCWLLRPISLLPFLQPRILLQA